jgi:ATP-binding cassette, subfamily B, bacterial
MKTFRNYVQFDIMDCGPTCLKMIARHYGKTYTLDTLRKKTKISRYGVTLQAISVAAENIGFSTMGAIVNFEQLRTEVTMPAIAHWDQNHFVVIYKVTDKKVYVSDPAAGNKVYKREEFMKLWSTQAENNERMGIVLILEPGSAFYEQQGEKENSNIVGLSSIFRHLQSYKKEIGFVLLAIAVSSLFQFIFPFLTQSIVDSGISAKDLSFVAIILLAQFALLLGRFFVEYIRSWLLLFVNSRVNVSILSDFLIKLMRLPISYFDTKMSGDILQRMNDQRRIQDFLSGPALELVFSFVTIVILGATLFIYNKLIFLVFLLSSLLYTGWTILLLKRRTTIDFKRFELSSKNHTETMQIITGIQDIKLNNAERQKRWNWEKVQAKLFRLQIDSLRYQQIQQSGAFLINEGKNLFITYIAASSVINDKATLGVMLAIQAIVGQLNGPISLMINLILSYHDTKISLERLSEVHILNDEEPVHIEYKEELPEDRTIKFVDMEFTYPGMDDPVISNLNLEIPAGKTTAIVGASGSGKTTLLKILLKFYDNYEGNIEVGETNLREISSRFWRSRCGTVMQDGFIFSDTIANNICVDNDNMEWPRVEYAIKMANLNEFISSLPLGANTRIGAEGMGISQGQRQRILIARAIYKNPDYLFFDEATNALDANNESIIIKNLEEVFENKTVVVVAHRLSTVKNADQIIVLDKGEIVEQGTHAELTSMRGNYFTLVKNQLELGN